MISVDCSIALMLGIRFCLKEGQLRQFLVSIGCGFDFSRSLVRFAHGQTLLRDAQPVLALALFSGGAFGSSLGDGRWCGLGSRRALGALVVPAYALSMHYTLLLLRGKHSGHGTVVGIYQNFLR